MVTGNWLPVVLWGQIENCPGGPVHTWQKTLSGLPGMWFGRPFVTLIIVNKLFEVVIWTILVTIVRLFCSEFNYYKRVVLLGWCNTHHSFCTELVILWYFAVEIMLLLFSHSVVSDSLWPHGLQHSRLSCPSPSLRVCSDTCLLSQWCHPTVSSSVTLFSSCLQSFPASGSFLMSQLFASGGQSIGALALASVLPMNIQIL